MLASLQVLSIIVVAIAMALALAHALELPGKMRLSKERYLAVQPIYYPGFTIGGIAEPVALLLILLLLFLTPFGGSAFWLTAGAFLALLAMHATYWILTHPVNNFWLRDFELKGAGKRFFALGLPRAGKGGKDVPWTELRDRWEYSHVLRSGLGLVSLGLLATATAA
jgi:hypothetical protein